MLNRAHREPVVPVVVVLRINTTTIEVQVPRITGRIERSGPVVAVRTTVVPRRSIAVAGASKNYRSYPFTNISKNLHGSQVMSLLFPSPQG